MTDVVIRNIGALVTGSLEEPMLDADTLVIHEGQIAQIGGAPDVGADALDIDACGVTVMPGLIDSHVHPVLGDYTPRQNASGFLAGCVHGGVTSVISAGEVHTPGRPTDPDGVIALAVLAQRAHSRNRPHGLKIHAGALLLEPGLTEAHFERAAAAGVSLVGEIGVSGLHDPEEAGEMLKWAHQRGMRSTVHTGGASIPGSSVIDAEFVLTVQPTVAAHVNGGPTALPREDVERLATESDIALEVVQCGNVRALRDVLEVAATHQAMDRVIIGTDMPSGTGVIPLGMLRTISWAASICGMEPAEAVALATGNTARLYGLDSGEIKVGRQADLVLADAPRGSTATNAMDALRQGDTLAVAGVIVDGEPQLAGSRNAPPPMRRPSIPGLSQPSH